jgi:uncharacterized repeat protein (TIGR01451 family)
MIGMNRRKSVMGNGRWLGRSSRKSLLWVRALGAMLVLLLAGSLLLGLSFRRYAQKATAPLPASPIPDSSPSSLRSDLAATLHAKPDARAILGQLPLVFEPNQGQADAPVKFLARGAGYGLFLDPTGATLSLQTARSSVHREPSPLQQLVRMKLVGANPAAVTSGTDPLPGKSNYILGNDAHQWHTGVPQFAGVHYAGVYPGIDLVFYGNQGHLEYDFKVAPGADPSQAELQFEGASKLGLSGGDLILTSRDEGGLRLQAPQIYQREGDRHQPVAGRFVLRAGNRVGFEIGPYDHSRELIIDPILLFSTYFGGNGAVTLPSVAVNGDGYIYLVGSNTGSTTGSGGFPVTGTLLPNSVLPNIFVAKINPSSPPSVAFLTFLGGSGTDNSVGIGVDTLGNSYIVGNTDSPDFPTSSTNVLGYQQTPETKTVCTSSPTCTSIFVTVLNALGNGLNYSSYLSGNGDDVASGMTIDLNGDVFLTGTTTSSEATQPAGSEFPATQIPVPYQSTPIASIQFFATKVNTGAVGPNSIAYSTYFGGSTPVPPIAIGGGIAVDPTGNMYFDGTTNFFNSGSGQYGDSIQGTDFPILNAYQPCLDTVPPLVLPNLNPCTAPTTTPYPTDAFVAKINPNAPAGNQLLFSTYLGGLGTDSGTAIALNSGATSVYLTGGTNSSNFVLPTGGESYQQCLGGNVLPCPVLTPAPTNAYVAVMSNPTVSTTGTPNDVALTYFTYLGGSTPGSTGVVSDTALAITVDSSNDAVLTGLTTSTNFPFTSICALPPCAIQTTLNGPQNAFFAQIELTTTGQANGSYVTYFGGNGVDRGTSIAIDPNQNTYFAGDTTSTANFQVADFLQQNLSGTQDAFVVKLGTANGLTVTCVATCVSPEGIVSAGNQVTITFIVANEGPDPATNITVTGQVSPGATFNSASAASGTCGTPSGSTATCQIPTLQSGSTSNVVFVVTPTEPGGYQITGTASNANNTNLSSRASANFTAGGFNLSIGPSAQTVVAGLTATYSVQLSPSPVFGANVSLACGSLPGGTTCSFSSSSVTLNGPQSSTLNLQTAPQPVPIANSRSWRSSFYALWLMVPGLAVWGLGGKRRRSWWLGGLTLCVLFALIFLQPSCSGGRTQPTVTGTPTGTYSLTVTATSGSLTKSVPFSLTVTP